MDSTAGRAFVFANANPSGQGLGSLESSYVVQNDTMLSSGSQVNGLISPLGTASTVYTAKVIHTGTFDNLYLYGSSPGSQGHLYICGRGTTGTLGQAALFAFGFSSGVMQTTAVGSPLNMSTDIEGCSPLTENCIGAGCATANTGTSTDRLFVGITANCAFGTGTSGGCVESLAINSFPSTATAAPEPGGTTGIVGDNFGSTGTSAQQNIYFLTQGAGAGSMSTNPLNCEEYNTATNDNGHRCAVSLTQSSLD